MLFEYLENQKFIAFSHRGGALENKENTIEAFQKSVDIGYRYIETDVQNTKDDKLVIFHDDDLVRINNQNIKIAEITYEELENIFIFDDQIIPLFEDTINNFSKINFNIDPKTDRASVLLKNLLINRNDLERFCIGSHFQHRLDLFNLNKFEKMAISMSRQEVIKLYINQYLYLFKQATPCVQVPTSFKGITIVNEKLIKFIHDQDKKIHVWTVDDQDEMQRLIDLGVDGIMTDRPSLLKEILIKNNLWD